jgi:hypothetical protein
MGIKESLRRLEDLERQSCTDEPPEDLHLYLYWNDINELTPEQQEANRRCREWYAEHPGASLTPVWADDL